MAINREEQGKGTPVDCKRMDEPVLGTTAAFAEMNPAKIQQLTFFLSDH
jgi:hypothetical protein